MRSDKSKELTVEIINLCNGYNGGEVIIALADALGAALVALSEDRQNAIIGYSMATNLAKGWLTADAHYGHGSRAKQ